MNRFFKIKVTGFSLIEVSISLLIVGIVSSICISQLSTFLSVHKMQKTYANFEIIVNSIGLYLKTDKDLPKPKNIDASGFGRVPFEDLGIMENFAKDGYGKWILYRVNEHFRKPTTVPSEINLGIKEFSGKLGDKVAFILKSVKDDGTELFKIWHGEKTFLDRFPPQNVDTPRTSGQGASSPPVNKGNNFEEIEDDMENKD